MKETIEQAAKELWKQSSPNPIEMAIFGKEWRQERSYDEDEVLNLLYRFVEYIGVKESKTVLSVSPKKWFEQFKKK